MKNTIVHIPHSSTYIPRAYLPLFYLKGGELRREQLYMTDLYTDDLFADVGTCVTFPVSRLICDVERFRTPETERMTARGMWVCYERASDLRLLKAVTPAHRREILTKWYDPHHARLTRLTARSLKDAGQTLIIDAHSFSSVRLPYEQSGGVRPDICIGTDDFHTPNALAGLIAARFRAMGYTVALNQPFAGCLIPMEYYRRDKRVSGIMIEVNRRLYMAEDTGEKRCGYARVKRDLTSVLRRTLR